MYVGAAARNMSYKAGEYHSEPFRPKTDRNHR
jgi:hypothetical protein